ncbi:MAG: guanylate kinase [Pseudomonadota bacterium]
MPPIARRGLALVVSAPSGAGKTTLCHRLLNAEPDIVLSVSVTTRPARAGEQDGVDYVYLSQDEFQEMRAAGDLLEWARVFENYYGTPRQPVEERLSQGKDVLFDIDWQGAQQLSEKLTQDLVRVFILPPSANVLKDRLKRRGLDSPEVVSTRLSRASDEISHWAQYDYVIVNESLDISADQLRAILVAERARRERRIGLARFVRELQGDL